MPFQFDSSMAAALATGGRELTVRVTVDGKPAEAALLKVQNTGTTAAKAIESGFKKAATEQDAALRSVLPQLDAIQGKWNDIGTTAKNLPGIISRIPPSLALVGIALAGILATFKAIEMSARVLPQAERFAGARQGFAALRGPSARADLARLQQAAQGSLSRQQILAETQFPLAQGAGLESTARLLEEVNARTTRLGENTAHVFEQIMFSAVSKNTQNLHTYGIALTAADLETLNLDQRVQLITQHMDEFNKKLGGTPEGGSVQRWRAQVQDAKDATVELGGAFLNLVGMPERFGYWADLAQNFAEGVQFSAAAVNVLDQQLDKLGINAVWGRLSRFFGFEGAGGGGVGADGSGTTSYGTNRTVGDLSHFRGTRIDPTDGLFGPFGRLPRAAQAAALKRQGFSESEALAVVTGQTTFGEANADRAVRADVASQFIKTGTTRGVQAPPPFGGYFGDIPGQGGFGVLDADYYAGAMGRRDQFVPRVPSGFGVSEAFGTDGRGGTFARSTFAPGVSQPVSQMTPGQQFMHRLRLGYTEHLLNQQDAGDMTAEERRLAKQQARFQTITGGIAAVTSGFQSGGTGGAVAGAASFGIAAAAANLAVPFGPLGIGLAVAGMVVPQALGNLFDRRRGSVPSAPLYMEMTNANDIVGPITQLIGLLFRGGGIDPLNQAINQQRILGRQIA